MRVEIEYLMKFYGVDTWAELIHAQQRHVAGLQDTLRKLKPTEPAFVRVRMG